MSTQTAAPGSMEVVETDLLPYEDTDDPDARTHIVRPADNEHITLGEDMRARDIVDTARLLGVEVVALCGHRWVPKADPAKYDTCHPCVETAGRITRGEVY